MPRELGPIELRVCRMVFALLGLMILAFLGLGTIDSVFNLSPHIMKVQSQDPTYAAGRYSTQLSKSSPQTQGADSQKDSQGRALHDDSVGVVVSSTEIHSHPVLERAIRFDPGLLDRRVEVRSFIPAEAGANSPPPGTFQSGPQREIFTPAFASAEAATVYRSEEALAESQASNRRGQPNELSVGRASLSREDVQQIQGRLRDPRPQPRAAARVSYCPGNDNRALMCSLVNQYRAQYGLRPVQLDSAVTREAQYWSDQLNLQHACWFLHHDYNYHARMRARFPGRRYRENAACSGSTGGGAQFILQKWIDSLGHRQNMLTPEWRTIGAGVTNNIWVIDFTN